MNDFKTLIQEVRKTDELTECQQKFIVEARQDPNYIGWCKCECGPGDEWCGMAKAFFKSDEPDRPEVHTCWPDEFRYARTKVGKGYQHPELKR